ncbi:MAG: dihydroorotate dehydrogenase-like protein [Pseudomonadales bacterium]
MTRDLTGRYLGLDVRCCLIASSSPLTASLDGVRRLEDHGIGAVVLPSLVEADIDRDLGEVEALALAGAGSPEVCGGFLPGPAHGPGAMERILELAGRAASALDVPVVASVHAYSDGGWSDLAQCLEQAGAAAIELNLYEAALDPGEAGKAVEARVLSTVRRVRAAVSIPLAVKLSPFYSNLGHMALAIQDAGADGLSLFNRPHLADIDLVRLRLRTCVALSRRGEMGLPMLWIAALHGRTKASLAATTGVESADDVIRYLLAGSDTVMTASALLRHGPEYTAVLVAGMKNWLDARGFSSVGDIRGRLAHAAATVAERGFGAALGSECWSASAVGRDDTGA